MSDHDKSKIELLAELKLLRQRCAKLEAAEHLESRAAEEKWRSIVRNAPVFMSLIDHRGTITFLNRTQPGTKVEDAVGRSVFDYTQPDYHATLREALAGAFENGRNAFFTSVAAGPNGQAAWYETYVAPVVVAGKVVSASFIAVDVTERKMAEQQLSTERNRAQKYFDIAGAILLVLDRNGIVELLNRAGRVLLGYADGELIGKNWINTCVPAHDRTQVATIFNRMMKGEVEPIELHENAIITRAGKERIIAWHNTLLTDTDGRPIGTLSSGLDVTRQRQTQQALERTQNELEQRVRQRTLELSESNRRLSSEIEERRTAETQLQVIYDGMVDGLLVAEFATKRVVRVNSSICRMFGYSKDELLQLSIDDLHPPAGMHAILEHFKSRADRDVVVAENAALLRKDGSIFYGDIASRFIVYGGVRCLIGFCRDITERKEARETLQREHRVLRDLLKSQDRERQLIAYDIHDGLAQQLVGAIMQFEMVHLQASQNKPEAMENCDAGLRMLRKALAEARRLIGGLRPPILDELGVVAAIGHIVHDESDDDGPEIDFRTDIAFERLEPALENTIYRVVQECLTNARRYSQSEKIRIELVQENDRLRIEVIDWGIGFDPTVERDGSFGLEGITERARLLGGLARVDSKPGEGTRIRVVLPLAFAH